MDLFDSLIFLYLLTGLELFFAFIVFLVLTQTSWKSSYGRYATESWFSNFTIPSRISWFVQEIPCLIVPAFVIMFGECRFLKVPANLFVISLLLLHYFQRCLIYPFLIRGGKSTPVHIFLLAFCFCSFNSYLQTAYHCNHAEYKPAHLTEYTSVVGIFLFVFGMAVNIHSDHILRNLRKPGERAYKIPRGGLFEHVSGANFFGEIVQWFGFAFVARSLPAFAFAVFTLSNIGPRALQHHKWYREKFEDYPKNRKALIPFVL